MCLLWPGAWYIVTLVRDLMSSGVCWLAGLMGVFISSGFDFLAGVVAVNLIIISAY